MSTSATTSRRRLSPRQAVQIFQHGYIILCLLVFVLPFLTTLAYSLQQTGGGYSLGAYQYVFGSFKDTLTLSLVATLITILLNLLIAIPAAYAIVRFPVPGKSVLL